MVVLGGCASISTGPSVMVLPAPGKPFELFQADDSVCRQWAAQQIGAGTGRLGGASVGADADRWSGWDAQRRYDIAYQQCVHAKGDQIPGVKRETRRGYRMPPPPQKPRAARFSSAALASRASG